MFHWIFLLFIVLVLVVVERPLCPVVTPILECYKLFSRDKLSIRSFFFLYCLLEVYEPKFMC